MNLTSFGLILISLSQTVSAILDNYAVRSTDRPWMSEWANRPRPGWTITRRPFGTGTYSIYNCSFPLTRELYFTEMPVRNLNRACLTDRV